MKNKIIFYLSFVLILFPHISLAVVNLPWSSTYNCNEWKTSDGQNPNCDSMWEGGGWTCDNGDGTYKEEQITAAANYSGGGGGKGQRHWLGDGVNNTSGGMSASFLSSQTEIWVRWYMRYEQGFEWNPYLMNQKILYFDPVSFPRLIVEYYGQDKVQIYSYASSQGYPSAEGNGWNTMMANGSTDARGNKTSDGQWHLWEFHVKIDTNSTDGILELWIDNNKVINVTNANLAAAPLTTLLIGSNGFTPGNGRCMFVDYDDITISNTGPIGGNTPPPSGGNPPSNNTGNDSSASGGSGCGFVKDDGKGQNAKGEGLALMMMLIISLTMIFVLGRSTRRIKAISIILKAFILAIFMAVLLLPGVSLAANYYIDYQSGSDANSGTSKSSPWQRAPGMAGSSGVYTHQAGDNFIFKGGATWPSAAFPLTIGYSGDAAASDEYTVDKTWYAGSNWTRPIFDGENVTQKFITASNKHYIVIDNIEFTKSDTDYTDSYGNMPYSLYLTSISHWEIKNNYFHDLNAQYSGTLYDNGGYTIYIQASGGFISIHDNMAERVYMHRFAVVGPSSDFSTFEFYNNTVSDVAVGLVFGANNAYTFDNIQIHDNDFSKPYMPYADHSLDGSLAQLNGAIDALQTTINVVNGAVFTSGYNFVIQIGSEYIYVPAGGKTGNTLNNVTRGYAGSTAQAHVNLDSVGLTCSDPWHGDYIHIYQIGSGSITNAKIYNNYFHPVYSGPMPPYPCNSSTWDGGMTAYLYLENHLASPMIYNNIFEGDDEGISMQFSIRNATNPLVLNNTFIGLNKKIGLGIADASINAVVKNNIFSNVKYGITVSADSLSGFTSDNNNFHGLNAVGQFGALQCTGNSTFCSSLSDWQNILGGCPNAGNDCSSSTDNPLLDSNYRLTSSSPLTVRDAGAALSSYFSTDKDGVSRPQGSAWDIGAYEYCASGSCTGGGGGSDTGGNTGNSGGDSSSSGGSGCGFVREDSNTGSKSQSIRAADLGVLILLFLLLILLRMRKRFRLSPLLRVYINLNINA